MTAIYVLAAIGGLNLLGIVAFCVFAWAASRSDRKENKHA